MTSSKYGVESRSCVGGKKDCWLSSATLVEREKWQRLIVLGPSFSPRVSLRKGGILHLSGAERGHPRASPQSDGAMGGHARPFSLTDGSWLPLGSI